MNRISKHTCDNDAGENCEYLANIWNIATLYINNVVK